MKQKGIISLFFLLLFSIITFAQNSEMDPAAAKAYNDGNKFLKSGNYEGAVKQYQDALKSSKDYRIYYQLGITYKKQGKLTDAEEAFKSSIASNPKFEIAYNGLGSTYFADGKFSEAVDNFKKFEELTTKKPLKEQAKEYIARALVKLGENAKKDGSFDKAIQYFTDATNTSKLDAAFIALAQTLIENGTYDKALANCDQVIGMKGSRLVGAAYYYKGLAYKGIGDKDKAKENFDLAKKDPLYKKNSEYELSLLK